MDPESLAIKLESWRRPTRVTLFSIFALGILARIFDVSFPRSPLGLVGLIVILFVLCWCFGIWCYVDAFHPKVGWLRVGGKAASYFPWLRSTFIIALLVLTILPTFMALYALWVL